MRRVVLLFVLIGVLCLPVSAAAVITPVLVSEDWELGYEYDIPGLGTFYSSVTVGGSGSLAVITLGEDLYATAHCDGTEIPFEDGIFSQNGSYQLRIYSSTGSVSDYGLFTFSIANNYFDTLTNIDTEMVENPALILSYDSDSGQFIYTIDDNIWFGCNVPLGGQYNGQSTVSLSENFTVLATYLDGTLIATPENLTFSQRGNYSLSLVYNIYGLYGNTTYSTTLQFSLGADLVTEQTLLPSPYGMRLVDISLDGTNLPIQSENFAYLTQDGVYQLSYVTDGISYTRTFLRDSTAPYIEFSIPMDGSVITDDLTFVPSDPSATISVQWNRMAVTMSEYLIVHDGDYVITITDNYGNARTYEFTLNQANDNWAGYLWLIPLVGVGAGLIYISRRLRFSAQVM